MLFILLFLFFSCARPSPLRVVRSNSPGPNEPTNPSITNFNGKKIWNYSSKDAFFCSWSRDVYYSSYSSGIHTWLFFRRLKASWPYHHYSNNRPIFLLHRLFTRWHPTDCWINSNIFTCSSTIDYLYFPITIICLYTSIKNEFYSTKWNNFITSKLE